ncbi:MAG: universal stress protein [Candidatus Dormibacteria bacterium]
MVLGSVGSGPLKRRLLGSVAHRLLQIAPCPVLVVPAREP